MIELKCTLGFWVRNRIFGTSASMAGGEYADRKILDILDVELKPVRDEINRLQAIEMRRDDLERILVKVERRTLDLAEEFDDLKSKTPKWISVDERLPEKNGVYICAMDNDGGGSEIGCLRFVSGLWPFLGRVITVTHWLDGVPALPEKKQ